MYEHIENSHKRKRESNRLIMIFLKLYTIQEECSKSMPAFNQNNYGLWNSLLSLFQFEMRMSFHTSVRSAGVYVSQGPRCFRKQRQPCCWSVGIIPPPLEVSIASSMVTTSSISGLLSGLASQHRFITLASEPGQHLGISGLKFCRENVLGDKRAVRHGHDAISFGKEILPGEQLQKSPPRN